MSGRVWARASVEAWANERARDVGCWAWALVQAGVGMGVGVSRGCRGCGCGEQGHRAVGNCDSLERAWWTLGCWVTWAWDVRDENESTGC
jgi:hypothetical protein